MRTHGVYFPDGSKPRAVSSTNELGQSAGASMTRAAGQQPILTGDNAASTHFNITTITITLLHLIAFI